MSRKCAWCDTAVRESAAPERVVTHILCGGCLEDLKGELEEKPVDTRQPSANPS